MNMDANRHIHITTPGEVRPRADKTLLQVVRFNLQLFLFKM